MERDLKLVGSDVSKGISLDQIKRRAEAMGIDPARVERALGEEKPPTPAPDPRAKPRRDR
jgi:hypothetical protein